MHDIANYWAGTESSYHAYLADLKTVATIEPQSPTPSETPRLLSKQGDVAVINIHGRLTNTEAWYSSLMGDSSYPAIREALINAAQDPGIKAIALDIKSGGGMVSGVQDTADLVTRIDTGVKPVYAYSDGTIASAAYWLGSSARSLEIGATTEIGSIGVLAVHQENSKMLDNMGVKTTIVRSGKFKALGHSAEPLSEEGKATIQAQVNQLNDLFVAHVAQARKTSPAVVEATYGQGRMFIGKAGVDVGLADGVTSFDKFMSNIRQGIDKRENSMHISQNNYNKGKILKHALTDQEIAAMASGAAASVQATATDPAPVTAPTPEPVTAPVAATPTPEPTAPVTASLEVQVADGAVVALLQTQLAAAQAQVVALSVDLQTTKAAADTQHKQADAMRPIVRAAVSNLRVALGGTAAGVEAMTDDLLMAEHANLATQFQAKFKAGGVAAVSSSAGKESQVVELDPLRQARLAATRIGK